MHLENKGRGKDGMTRMDKVATATLSAEHMSKVDKETGKAGFGCLLRLGQLRMSPSA